MVLGEATSSLDGGKHPSKRKRFSINFNWHQVVNFVNFVQIMLALIVLSSITKKGEIVRQIAPLGHYFMILVIE